MVGVMVAVAVVFGGGDGGGASVCVDGSEATVHDLGKNNGNLQLTNDTEHQSHGTPPVRHTLFGQVRTWPSTRITPHLKKKATAQVEGGWSATVHKEERREKVCKKKRVEQNTHRAGGRCHHAR